MKLLKEAIIWLPKQLSTNYQVLINSTDVTSNTLFCECTLIATEGIGEFTLLLENNSRVYNGLWSGGETVYIYIDYSDASNLIFKGIVESVKKKFGGEGNQLELKGGHVSSELLGIQVTKSFTDTEPSAILTSLVSSYLTGYTTTNVTASSVTTTISWESKPFWQCVIDLCNVANFDCYVDNNKDFHFFLSESIENTEEAILETDTLISQEGLDDRIQEIKNRVNIEGADIDGIKVMYMKEDSTSQSSYNLREITIKDENIATQAQAEARATAELTILKNPSIEGKANCFGLPKLNPGDMVYVSIPTQNLLAMYKASKIIHRVGANVDILFGTDVNLDKEPKALHQILKSRIEKEQQIQKGGNTNQMKFSAIYPFDSSSEGTLSNLGISGGKLYISSGSTGTFTSTTHTAPSTITSLEVRANVSDDILIGTTCTVEVSCDNGVSYTTISSVGLNGNSGTKYDIDSSKQGTKLLIKATLTSTATYANPEINSIGALYK